MHILITAKAKIGQLYQCTPLIVGDRYSDNETMSFLGARLTRDALEPSGPPVFTLVAAPMAVMDALQGKGFELKSSTTVEGYITWMMSKPMEKCEEAPSTESQFLREDSPTEPRNREEAVDRKHTPTSKSNQPSPCAVPTQTTPLRKTTSVQQTKSKEKGTQNISTQTVDTQDELSQTDVQPGKGSERSHEKSDKHSEKTQPTKSRSETSQPEKAKSDASQTDPPAKKSQTKVDVKSKSKTEKETRSSHDGGKPAKTKSDEMSTISSESSVAARKPVKREKTEESPSKKKKKSTASAVSREEEGKSKK
ncbi:hypothetical protein GE061_013619 [Apolygus lucorum]|uniref:Uncharacterized protein n=1 Tax=Apolygus lucorum TaxID=248454 RepID=A0A6A4KDG7_APOLU|nr:hypothetical protein GE061_013619 [Apolygus lucorum]